MRGLDIRIAYAKAKLLSITDQKGSEDAFFEAINDAQLDGYSDYQAGLHGVPIMFADEPSLRRAWLTGWNIGDDGQGT